MLIWLKFFFAHWLKEADIKRYEGDIPILPKNNVIEICRYSDAMLQYIPEKYLETFQSCYIEIKKLY